VWKKGLNKMDAKSRLGSLAKTALCWKITAQQSAMVLFPSDEELAAERCEMLEMNSTWQRLWKRIPLRISFHKKCTSAHKQTCQQGFSM